GDDEAEGYWYLYDIFIQADTRSQTTGTALYKDRYRRIDGEWKIVATEYDRLIEFVGPMDSETQITVQYLATRGLRPEEREDIRHLITFEGAHG
ncbi:MAG: nuclear transport factor 2 family protein, partial [Novosphingobium sp.]|nr:nuclear transport factor 2 family protein [Novosphingobium sp.]